MSLDGDGSPEIGCGARHGASVLRRDCASVTEKRLELIALIEHSTAVVVVGKITGHGQFANTAASSRDRCAPYAVFALIERMHALDPGLDLVSTGSVEAHSGLGQPGGEIRGRQRRE
jgi:hypothetical protein